MSRFKYFANGNEMIRRLYILSILKEMLFRPFGAKQKGFTTGRRLMRFIALLIALVLLGSSLAKASWVDDWFKQKTGASSGYFAGQKRGYFTGGSFSARVPMSSDYLITITPPKIKTGCGGIDVLNGGLGFVNFDLLMKKLQGILQTAPMVAFDLALNVLCEPCAKSIKSIEGIVNALNGLQLDDCQASRALVAYTMDQMLPGESPAKKELGSIVQEFMSNSGINKLGYEVSKSIQGDKDKIPAQVAPAQDGKGTPVPSLDGCPTELKEIFATPGSFLQNVSNKIKSLSGDHLDLIRGIVGDIEIKPDLVSTAYISPCPENTDGKLGEIIATGDGYSRAVGGAGCTKARANESLTFLVRKQLVDIADIYSKKSALSFEQIDFIDHCPLPVAQILQAAVTRGDEPLVIQNLTQLLSRAYAYQFLLDLYNVADHAIAYAHHVSAAKSNAKEGSEQWSCQQGLLTAKEKLVSIKKASLDAKAAAWNEYTKLVSEYVAIETLLTNFNRVQLVVTNEVKNRFGTSTASRILN